SAFGPAGELESVRAHLTATLGHLPSPYDLAAVMGMTVDELGALQSDLDRDPARSIDRLFAGPARDPDQHVPEREQLGYLGAAIADLPHQLRDIITLYFFGQRRLGEIATELGVSDSRLQQMRAEALRLLRDGINGRLNPAVSARVVDSARESATQSAYSTSDRAARVPQKNIPAVLKSGADGPMGGLPAHGRDGRAARLTTTGSQIMEEHR
ncbi:MAG TPA: sigma factor-like helix-turn-helix DNA-binding protein, partial [Mycobacterium sp.]|nr:sigma factor-like helix-turn-helix DNA-binding protein [Mycobacterium sp.]